MGGKRTSPRFAGERKASEESVLLNRQDECRGPRYYLSLQRAVELHIRLRDGEAEKPRYTLPSS